MRTTRVTRGGERWLSRALFVKTIDFEVEFDERDDLVVAFDGSLLTRGRNRDEVRERYEARNKISITRVFDFAVCTPTIVPVDFSGISRVTVPPPLSLEKQTRGRKKPRGNERDARRKLKEEKPARERAREGPYLRLRITNGTALWLWFWQKRSL